MAIVRPGKEKSARFFRTDFYVYFRCGNDRFFPWADAHFLCAFSPFFPCPEGRKNGFQSHGGHHRRRLFGVIQVTNVLTTLTRTDVKIA